MKNTLVVFAVLATVLIGVYFLLPFIISPSIPQVPAHRPEVVSFTVDRSNIEKGTSTVLHWNVIGADTITIDSGVGPVAAVGSREISPSDLSAYNLTASNEGGTIVSTIIVNVKPFVKITTTASTASSAIAPPAALKVLPKLGPNESYVFYGEAVMVGANEHYIILRNNPVAHDPTWAELKAFLQTDNTDKHVYVKGMYTCGDFAETLHNNAEQIGIRTGLVAIELQSSDGSVVNHSLNMFDTTDKGLLYIDETSSSQGYYADKIVDVALGRDYISNSIFPQPGQMQVWPSMGKVLAFDIKQW